MRSLSDTYEDFFINDVLIALWPSPSEINTSDENDNAYLGGLTIFYHSLDELEMDLRSTTIFKGWKTHAFRERNAVPFKRASPPIIAEILIWMIGSFSLLSGAIVALYKVLDLWAKKVDGRRIKVTFSDFEIETTQLTEEQFVKLLQKILELRDINTVVEKTAALKKELVGYSMEERLSSSLYEQKLHLNRLQFDAREKIQQKLFASDENLAVDQEDTFSNRDELPEQMGLLSEQIANIHQDQKDATPYPQETVVKYESEQHLLNVSEKTNNFINIYISSAFSSEDEALLDDLVKQLSILKRQTDVYLWDKHHIAPGIERKQEISTYLNQAHLILLLLSPDFFASSECYEEMELAIKRSDKRQAHVIPILIRYSAGWQDTLVGKLEPLPSDREPISNRVNREKAMHDIAEHIQQAVEKIRQSISE